jgi:hypothetical protein
LPYQGYSHIYNIQLMTFDEMNTRIDQPMEHDIHRVIRWWLATTFKIIGKTPFLFYGVWRSVGILCSTLVTFCMLNITFYQRSLQRSKHFISKSKYWLAWNKDNVSKQNDMSTHRLLFQWASMTCLRTDCCFSELARHVYPQTVVSVS